MPKDIVPKVIAMSVEVQILVKPDLMKGTYQIPAQYFGKQATLGTWQILLKIRGISS